MKKKIALMLCMVFCLLTIAGCSLTRENNKLAESKLTKETKDFVNSWFKYDFGSAIKTYKTQLSGSQKKDYTKYAKMQKDYGALKKTVKSEYSAASDTATVTNTIVTKSGKKLVFTVTYDKKGKVSNWKVAQFKSIGSIMGRAGLNTIMSMAIVFMVLIFISLIISCFAFINKSQAKKATITDEVAEPASLVMTQVEDLVDDLELVAVITAAIAACSENESTDGLVVRSIIRR